LKWPAAKYLFGFVGAAQVGGLPMDRWLASLTKEFETKASLKEIATELHKKVQAQRSIDEGEGPAQPLIIHIGGFEKESDIWLPYVWHIANTHKLGRFGYLDITKEFICTEVLRSSFQEVYPSEIRKILKVRAKQFQPFWFHQGIDLFTFNVLESAVKLAFKHLCEQHPDHDIPTTLEDWAKHVNMQILMYGAYYESFHSVGKRFVGGGVDTIYIPWP
jgi:hypothetical protein